MPVCDKAFSITVDNPCGVTTDWCGSPGSCRLRVKSFNPADWTLAWNGKLTDLGAPIPPFLPCYGFADATGFAGLGYNHTAGHWQFTAQCPDLSIYLAIGPVGPTGTSPLGLYTKDGSSDPGCGGPGTFTIESA